MLSFLATSWQGGIEHQRCLFQGLQAIMIAESTFGTSSSIDTRSILFVTLPNRALGCVIAEMLNLAPLFLGNDDADQLEQVHWSSFSWWLPCSHLYFQDLQCPWLSDAWIVASICRSVSTSPLQRWDLRPTFYQSRLLCTLSVKLTCQSCWPLLITGTSAIGSILPNSELSSHWFAWENLRDKS